MTTPTLLDDVSIEFFVPGSPAPQGSKKAMPIRNRATGQIIKINQVESSAAVGPWRERVAIAAHQAMSGRVLFEGALVVSLNFVLPRPKSAPKRSTPKATKRPDLDKLERAVLDALTGVCFSDDSHVVSLIGSKRIAEIGETAGVHIGLEVEP